MSRKELAKDAGVSVEFVRAIERGHRNPSFLTLLHLLRALDVDYEVSVRYPQTVYFDFDSEIHVLTNYVGRATGKTKKVEKARKPVFKSRKRCCHI